MATDEFYDIDADAYLEDVDEERQEAQARASRPADRRLPAILRRFITSGKPSVRVKHETLDRKYGGVAQDLRRLLKEMKTEDGVPYFHLAWVSANPRTQEVLLKRRPEGWRPPEGGETRGRPKGSVKKKSE